MTSPSPLQLIQYESILRRGLEEDLALAGDITTNAIVTENVTVRAHIVARAEGRVAGIRVATATFSLLDPDVAVVVATEDGTDVAAGDLLATVDGPVQPILMGERVALNVLGRMCGIATATRSIVEVVREFKATVVCTRKTAPGLRVLEKYAVRAGGGANHRFGLDDAVLIKDNHLLVAGGVREAVSRVQRSVGHLVKIEVEVANIPQLEEAMDVGVDAVLLDNMDIAILESAVSLVGDRALVEASGGITTETASAIAETGVDLLSVGWITHSAPALDVALDVDPASVRR